MCKHVIAVVLVAILSTAALAALPTIPMGRPTVDGDLSEWVSQNEQCPLVWHDLDDLYWSWTGSVPPDVSGAKYAALWDDATNKIYLAATGIDTSHWFTSGHSGWDQQDDLEVYVDAGDRDVEPYNDTYGYAQQWVVGPDGSGGTWAWLDGQAGAPSTDVSAVVSVVGDVISYEMAITPYYYYTGFGGTDEPETVVDLEAGNEIGLDVLWDSKWDDGNFFGMLADRPGGGTWFKSADQFQDHVLDCCDTGIPEPATIALLGLGGLALIRRKRS